ncbi:MAG: NusG domain II-containing protein [Firmicutes bacterium]|nr:NusG domain II-containing protein [Bacillota bacterium]
MDKRKLISTTELFVIGVVVILALCVYVFSTIIRANDTGIQAEIRMYGEIVKTISLDEDVVFSLAEHSAIEFIVQSGRIAFYKSDCPDQICVRNGFLHIAGQSSVCLPNRVVLFIVNPVCDGDGIDFFLD